jgi:hypothetical protein
LSLSFLITITILTVLVFVILTWVSGWGLAAGFDAFLWLALIALAVVLGLAISSRELNNLKRRLEPKRS